MNTVAGYNDNQLPPQSRRICRFYQRGMCRFGNRCRNLHSEEEPSVLQRLKAVAESTSNKVAVPDQEKNNATEQSSRSFVTSNNTSRATTDFGPGTSSSTTTSISVSSKECGICFDTIMEKQNRRDQTFGILPNCNHCFCFACIRKWRQTKEFDFDVSKACPECRKPSDYVYASRIWFELKEEKDKFISNEKLRMQNIGCRYFNRGSGSCPFGNTCLYLHALPNGKKMDVGPPRPRRRCSSNVDNEMLHQILYWLNDDEVEIEDDDDDEDEDDFELDLDDPLIAMQYYDHDDIRRYMAMDRLYNDDSDSGSGDYDYPLFL